MALCDVHFSSNTIAKEVGMSVIVPDTGSGPFATLYLLHGLSDDYTVWQRRTRIEWYVRKLPLIVVMPDGYRGFYTNNDQGPAYGDFFAEELPSFVERVFPAKRTRAGRSIGGLSMGGYGALRTALAHPDRFASAHSHSGALLAGTYPRTNRGEQREFRRIFGAHAAGTAHDLLALARRAARSRHMPRLRIDCGADDFLLYDSRQFHAFCHKLNIPHEYEEFAGAHDWDYWDQHIQDALRFHARVLRL